jgi:NAD(P)-dependent dehydrogenase (short-subunit alcohol dehydrogenase family)
MAGRTVIVTGAGALPRRGMGRAIAEAFAAGGDRVVAADIDRAAVQETAARIRASSGQAESVTIDVSRPEDVDRLVHFTVERFGGVDVLCNHAGIGDVQTVTETDLERWQQIVGVNLTGAFLASRAVLPHMLRAGGGVIINTISVCGLVGGRGGAAYTASKHGLVGLTRSIAATYGPKGIRCIGICPGRVATVDEDPSSMLRQSEAAEVYEAAYALNPRRGGPEEVADFVHLLAGQAAGFVNGAIIPVDGGWTAI